MQRLGDLADQTTPRQRAEQDQFRAARDLVKQPRQDVPAQYHRRRHQRPDAADRQQDHADLKVAEAGLHRQKQDGEDILQHQYAQGDAAGQRIEFALLVQHLDDDDGAAQRAGDAEIQRIEAARSHRQPNPHEEQDAEHATTHQLPAGGKQDHPAGAHDLLQIDFQPDHEQHEDQAKLGDDTDGFLRLAQARTAMSTTQTGYKVGDDMRLPVVPFKNQLHPT